ncbi:DUF3667 domain-containing protein [uncultured Flavobacterium sp.]|uniref:DUF3667 domain-containing protein n=1 Tax=uncultured Flavobacterium sp. TaxID=165435 RepID=UPI0030EBCC5A|tara:strand:+ start:28757 stop:29818 length:1062 start_codon:yes stop_codon:yes gene_type:complete
MSKRKSRQFRGSKCLNCETALDISEKYCHQCGQLNSTKKLTIGDFFEEFLSNFYAYDSRLRNSIVSIFTKPGVLAREFNEGKRQKYANPFRLFLSVSIVLFLTMSIEEPDINLNPNLEKEIENEKQINNIKDSLDVSVFGKSKNKDIASLKTEKLHKDSIYNKTQLDNSIYIFQRTISSYRNFHIKYPEKTTEVSLIELGYKNDYLNRLVFNKAITFKSNEITDELFSYFFQKFPILLFVTLPFLTIMFWLMFFSKSRNYTENLVFSYTFFTFMFVSFILFNLLEYFFIDYSNYIIFPTLLIIFPIYFYKSLRNFYQKSRWITILKFVLLNILFIPFAILSMFLILFLGVLFF